MKKFLIVLMVLVFCLSSTCFAKDISIVKNGQVVRSEEIPIVKNNRVLIPLRSVYELFSAEVRWENEDKSIGVKKDDILIKMTLGENKYFVNGEEKNLSTPPANYNGIIYVPIRPICDEFGYSVDWKSDSKIISVEDVKEEITEVTTEFIDEKKGVDVNNLNVIERETEQATIGEEFIENGSYKVGESIKAGFFSFRKNKNSSFGYLSIENSNGKNKYILESQNVLAELKDGDIVEIVNCDLYQNNKIYKRNYKGFSSKINMDFKGVSEKLKKQVKADIENISQNLEKKSIDKLKKSWDLLSSSNEDKMYLDLVKKGLNSLLYYVENNDNIEIKSYLIKDFKKISLAKNFSELEKIIFDLESYKFNF